MTPQRERAAYNARHYLRRVLGASVPLCSYNPGQHRPNMLDAPIGCAIRISFERSR